MSNNHIIFQVLDVDEKLKTIDFTGDIDDIIAWKNALCLTANTTQEIKESKYLLEEIKDKLNTQTLRIGKPVIPTVFLLWIAVCIWSIGMQISKFLGDKMLP
jgi:hypothetical protein